MLLKLCLTSACCQAIDAEAKDDREIVCSEVFADVTGTVDERAQGRVRSLSLFPENIQPHTRSPHMVATVACDCADKLKTKTGTRFYEVLAAYFNQVCQLG